MLASNDSEESKPPIIHDVGRAEVPADEQAEVSIKGERKCDSASWRESAPTEHNSVSVSVNNNHLAIIRLTNSSKSNS